jgi:signal transduction histidine kinase
MGHARSTAISADETDILNRMEALHNAYRAARQDVIALRNAQKIEESRGLLLGKVTGLYQQVFTLCEEYLRVNEHSANKEASEARSQIRLYTTVALVCAALTLIAGALLCRLFYVDILHPVRSLANDAGEAIQHAADVNAGTPDNELTTVGTYLRILMSDAADARTALERTRSQLLNAQKLASVGKLAASVAHELRNPITSVKMRLFSIQRTLGRDDELDRKFRSISEEIARMEGVIRSFLEFSRPPTIRLQTHALSHVLDKTLELVCHYMEEKNIRIVRSDAPRLPPINADADQLRQVLVNLLNNAAEAMIDGGEIQVSASVETDSSKLPMVVVRVRDTGGGISQEVRQHVFEPFYTTKEDGTGLGLCIAARIMAHHHGRLILESSTPQGTSFAMWIPVAQVADNG